MLHSSSIKNQKSFFAYLKRIMRIRFACPILRMSIELAENAKRMNAFRVNRNAKLIESVLRGGSAWARRALAYQPKPALPGPGTKKYSLYDMFLGFRIGRAGVRKTPSCSKSWANFSPFVAVFSQECAGQLGYFG